MEMKRLRIVSLGGSLLILVVIYFLASSIVPFNVNIGHITREHAGNAVNINGTIKDLTVNDGNAFFTLADSTGEIRVVIWESVMQELKDAGTDLTSLEENASVIITGNVDVYRGQLEIVPKSPDIKIIG